jgi:hypothetical protein
LGRGLIPYLTYGQNIENNYLRSRSEFVEKSQNPQVWAASGEESFYKRFSIYCQNFGLQSSDADPDPGSDAFLTSGSGIPNRFFPDPGSQTHIFESLVTILG